VLHRTKLSQSLGRSNSHLEGRSPVEGLEPSGQRLSSFVLGEAIVDELEWWLGNIMGTTTHGQTLAPASAGRHRQGSSVRISIPLRVEPSLLEHGQERGTFCAVEIGDHHLLVGRQRSSATQEFLDRKFQSIEL